MAHNERLMKQIPNGKWIIRCRVCSQARKARVFNSARECHEWWQEHLAGDRHIHAASYRADTVRSKQEIHNLLVKIFG